MRILYPEVRLIDDINPFIKIEKIGRVCYKSSSAFTEETANLFFKNLVARKHYAVLEHANFIFEVSEKVYHLLFGCKYFNYSVEEFENKPKRFIISGNLRAINEFGREILLRALHNIDPNLVYSCGFILKDNLSMVSKDVDCKIINIDDIPDIQETAYKTHKYFSFDLICDRGVSHELVRHRPSSFAQESTRYCSYLKEKFGGEISIILPSDYDNWNNEQKDRYLDLMKQSEETYLYLLQTGILPQNARSVLPTCLKTEIVITTNALEYEHIFNLRLRGITGSPHPDMKIIMEKAYEIYCGKSKF
ncbi:Thymidylate synthase ThyX [bioreactor metagenome]|uniref:Thymidylate synthase ThyX n=1 Tax=bioreactor metagenome TaxID=1076179 RepID=A0A645BYS3_9ZZZZ|nr:FAD-dependent thymidylate synthase [Oscillospiraceae bacterium]